MHLTLGNAAPPPLLSAAYRAERSLVSAHSERRAIAKSLSSRSRSGGAIPLLAAARRPASLENRARTKKRRRATPDAIYFRRDAGRETSRNGAFPAARKAPSAVFDSASLLLCTRRLLIAPHPSKQTGAQLKASFSRLISRVITSGTKNCIAHNVNRSQWFNGMRA